MISGTRPFKELAATFGNKKILTLTEIMKHAPRDKIARVADVFNY